MSDAYWRDLLNRFRNDGSCEKELLQALAEVERLREALEFINKRGAFGIRELDDLIRLALAQPGDAT